MLRAWSKPPRTTTRHCAVLTAALRWVSMGGRRDDVHAMRLVRAASLLVALSLAGTAHGEEPGSRCKGFHSLFSPLPEDCLEVIDTDRPHQTDTPHVVPAGYSQFESGLVVVRIGNVRSIAENRDTHLVFFENTYKFGLVSKMDFELLFKHVDWVPKQRALSPPGPLVLRGKITVVEENGWVPIITLVPCILVPMADSTPFRAGPLVFWGWKLPLRFEVEVNAGVLFGAAPAPLVTAVLASAVTYRLVDNFRIFGEGYAAGWDVQLGTGALWAFTKNMQVDFGTYIGVNGDVPAVTPFAGFSFRR